IQLETPSQESYQPGFVISLLCIVVPIFLIIAKSVMDYHTLDATDSVIYPFVPVFGTPVIALPVGVALSLLLPKKVDEKVYSATGWLGEALVISAPIILITGAGGIFGAMLQNSGIGDLITQLFSGSSMGLLLPFLLAACLKTTQGSSTVALITAASIVAPMMPALGLETDFDRTMAVMAIGAGSTVVSHANDSFFWVLTQLTGMDVKQGNKVQTLGTLILGVSSFIVVLIVSMIF